MAALSLPRTPDISPLLYMGTPTLPLLPLPMRVTSLAPLASIVDKGNIFCRSSTDFPVMVVMDGENFYIPEAELVAVDTSLLLRIVDEASSLRDVVTEFLSSARCGFLLSEIVLLECVNVMTKGRVKLAGAIPRQMLSRVNPRSKRLENGKGWTSSNYEHNLQLAREVRDKLLSFTKGWVFAKTEGTLAGAVSITDTSFKERCELYDARVIHEGWEYTNIIFSRDHHKVIIKGERDGKARKMLCINPLLMKGVGYFT